MEVNEYRFERIIIPKATTISQIIIGNKSEFVGGCDLRFRDYQRPVTDISVQYSILTISPELTSIKISQLFITRMLSLTEGYYRFPHLSQAELKIYEN